MSRAVVRREVQALVVGTRERVAMLASWTGVLWGVHLVNFMLGGWLNQLGIVPRSLTGLIGVIFAPFLHFSFGHLIANTIPFWILGFLVTERKKMDFYVVATAGAVVGGLGTWLIGASGTHLGASGVVYSFLGFLMARGIYDRRLGPVLLSAFVTVFFGGLLWGLLPFLQVGVSWEGHLFGFLGGWLAARSLGRGLSQRRR